MMADATEPDWLSERVRVRLQEHRPGAKTQAAEFVTSLRLPSWRVAWVGVALLALTTVGAWGLTRWGLEAPVPASSVHDAYVTLWQVDASIAALALPLLLLVIEWAADRDGAAASSSEVLFRRCWIFPIIVLAMVSAVKIGIDIAWFPDPGVFIVDFAMFVVTVAAVVCAFLLVLRLLFSPQAMHRAASDLQRQKLTGEIRAVIRSRVANVVLREGLRDIAIDYDPFGVGRPANAVIVRSRRVGTLTDVNFGGLSRLIARLPRPADPTAGLAVGATAPALQPAQSRPPTVWFAKAYGESVLPARDGVLYLDPADFGRLDVPTLERELESNLKLGPIDG